MASEFKLRYTQGRCNGSLGPGLRANNKRGANTEAWIFCSCSCATVQAILKDCPITELPPWNFENVMIRGVVLGKIPSGCSSSRSNAEPRG